MRLSILTINKIEDGVIGFDDLTPNQQLQYKQMMWDKKICENDIHKQIVNHLNIIGKFDVNEIGKIIEKYAGDDEEFVGMYNLLDFDWIYRQVVKE